MHWPWTNICLTKWHRRFVGKRRGWVKIIRRRKQHKKCIQHKKKTKTYSDNDGGDDANRVKSKKRVLKIQRSQQKYLFIIFWSKSLTIPLLRVFFLFFYVARFPLIHHLWFIIRVCQCCSIRIRSPLFNGHWIFDKKKKNKKTNNRQWKNILSNDKILMNVF